MPELPSANLQQPVPVGFNGTKSIELTTAAGTTTCTFWGVVVVGAFVDVIDDAGVGSAGFWVVAAVPVDAGAAVGTGASETVLLMHVQPFVAVAWDGS